VSRQAIALVAAVHDAPCMEAPARFIGILGVGVALVVCVLAVSLGWCGGGNDGAAERASGCSKGGHDPGSRWRDACIERAKVACSGLKGPELVACAESVGEALLRNP
jgi:hypothetical protein